MELEQIKIFCAAAEAGSFSRAARQLYISHSTVSRAMAELEASLGAELFLRGCRGVRLTAAGERLFSGGRALLRSADELEKTVTKGERYEETQ